MIAAGDLAALLLTANDHMTLGDAAGIAAMLGGFALIFWVLGR
jgi:hypothetical protein